MIKMFALKSIDVRKQWSTVVDNVVRKKPAFIKRTHDFVFLSDIKTINDILSVYKFNAQKFIEADGSVTLALNELDIAINEFDETTAINTLAAEISEYAVEFYENFETYSIAPNRQAHIPFIFKALILDNINDIKENIVIYQDGRI